MTTRPSGQGAAHIDISAFRLATTGRSFELSSGWWPGMPLAPGHPPFQVITYRTPPGERIQADITLFQENGNDSNFGFISELLSFCAHSGTHIDALAHVTVGENDEWHGGRSANEFLGNNGPLVDDARELPAFICRGVLLDAPAALGVDQLAVGQAVDADLVHRMLERQQVELREGDVVLLRTGRMANWPDTDAMEASSGAGLSLDGAEVLAAARPAALGADTGTVEVEPSGIAGEPQPVHRLFVHDLGVPLIEWIYLEELAAANVSEFLFVSLPLTITGATGSPIRPLAVI
jgi:kynurenine formamidase